MENFLFGTYQVFGLLLYLFLSAVLVYHRYVKRWVHFSIGFFIVHSLGSFVFFVKLPFPFVTHETLVALPYFLFFFGSLACVAHCLCKRLSLIQSIGLLLCYYFFAFTFVFLTRHSLNADVRLPSKGSIEQFLTNAPYIVFYIGSPIALGIFLYRGMGLRESIGAYIVFCFALLLLGIAISTYFHRSFGFAYELTPHASAWIEVAALLFFLFGFLALIGYCLLNSLCFRESMGALVIFLAVMGAVASAIHLTKGFEFLPKAYRSSRGFIP